MSDPSRPRPGPAEPPSLSDTRPASAASLNAARATGPGGHGASGRAGQPGCADVHPRAPDSDSDSDSD